MRLDTIMKMEDSKRKFHLLEMNLLKLQHHGQLFFDAKEEWKRLFDIYNKQLKQSNE